MIKHRKTHMRILALNALAALTIVTPPARAVDAVDVQHRVIH